MAISMHKAFESPSSNSWMEGNAAREIRVGVKGEGRRGTQMVSRENTFFRRLCYVDGNGNHGEIANIDHSPLGNRF